MRTVEINKVILLMIIFILVGCNENIKKTPKNKKELVFKNINYPKGEIIQNDTCDFTIIIKDTARLDYSNANFSRDSYKDYRFKIILENILDKPLFVKTTNYYGYIEFNWILKKEKDIYLLQMVSYTRDKIIDEFRFRKLKNKYYLQDVYNIYYSRGTESYLKKECRLPSSFLTKDTIDCTINNWQNADCKFIN